MFVTFIVIQLYCQFLELIMALARMRLRSAARFLAPPAPRFGAQTVRAHTLRLLALAAMALALVPAAAGAQDPITVTLPPAKDNTLYEDQGGTVSSGSGPYLFAGRTDERQNFRRRALIAFDPTSAIPGGSTIVSVELTMTVSRTISGGFTLSLHRVAQNWGEGASSAGGTGGQGVPSQTNDATWLHRFYPDQFWNNLGGDFDATASGSRLVQGVGTYTWPSTPELVADVQAWLDQPASNFGWLLRGNETFTQTAKRFDSREGENPPLLTVSYLPPQIPTISPIGLLVLGGALAALGAARLRRRAKTSASTRAS
jgi:hypothetical protein